MAAFAAGLAGLVAWVVARPLATNETFAWAASLPVFGLKLSITLLGGAVGSLVLMPSRTALLRDIRGEDDPPPGYPLMLLVAALGGIAVLRVPDVLAWWRVEWSFLQPILGEGPDPLGLSAIPLTVALSLPAATVITIALYVLTSVLAVCAPSKLVFRVLAASAVLQLAYIGAIVLTNREIHTLAAALMAIVNADPDASKTVADWLHLHDAAAGRAMLWLLWIYMGYLFAAAVAYFSPAGARSIETAPFETAPMPLDGTPAFTPSRTVHTSAAAADIDDSSYSVHPKMTLIESWFTRRCTNYEIRTIPRSSRKWFSFSWADGVLRRQPEGFELARLTPPSAPGRFLTRTYDVIDARTNEMLARFEPRGADWEIVDAFGNQLGRVLKSSVGGPVKYRAAVGDRDVVSFKWALAGLSTSSAELEVEFLASPGPDAMTQPSLDRVLALAIAPILEQRARIANERANSA